MNYGKKEDWKFLKGKMHILVCDGCGPVDFTNNCYASKNKVLCTACFELKFGEAKRPIEKWSDDLIGRPLMRE